MLDARIAVQDASDLSHASESLPTISREEIRARLKDPTIVLLNIMPAAVFEAGHIPGSVNLAVSEIEKRARHLFPDSRGEMVVYCAGRT